MTARHRSATIKPPPLVLPAPAVPSVPRQKFAPFAARPPSPSPTPTPTQPASRKFRAHLSHLLPRHAAFTVTITLHQLHNVPLVHGEFGLRWKIKGVTSHSGNGILDKVKARKAKPNPSTSTSASGEPPPTPGTPSLTAKGSDTDNASIFDVASTSDAHSITHSTSTLPPSPYSASGHATAQTHPLSIPAVVISTNHSSPPLVTRSTSVASMSSMSSHSSSSPHLNGHFPHNPPGYLSADWSRQAQDTAETLINPTPSLKAPAKVHYSPAKGITPFIRLKEHSVVWEQTLTLVVQMSVSRDNGELGDCLAKFVVMQRVVSGDPDAPRNPRLGAVYLNLAQYVDAGVVTRRYLLRQSKTNATLKLTIHVQHTAGETAYVAPPLPKAEILSGVAGFLESSDIYRTRPRASDLYTHDSSESSSDGEERVVGGASGSEVSSIVSGSGGSHEPRHPHGSGSGGGGGHTATKTSKAHRRPLDVSKLPTINDPRGTEKLIEALFNPVPVTEPGKVTPFTYLVEVDGEREGDGEGDAGGGSDCHKTVVTDGCNNDENDDDDKGKEEDEERSLYADSQDGSTEGQREGEGVGSDYHSLQSYPSFRSLRSKCSMRSLVSKVGLGTGTGTGRDDGDQTPVVAAPSVVAVSTGVHLLGSGVNGVTTATISTERRTWWQKVVG